MPPPMEPLNAVVRTEIEQCVKHRTRECELAVGNVPALRSFAGPTCVSAAGSMVADLMSGLVADLALQPEHAEIVANHGIKIVAELVT